MTSRIFGVLPNGETIWAFTLSNGSGLTAEILNYGGIITSLRVPSLSGAIDDVALGFDRLEPYLSSRAYFGAIIGRIAGRVTGGQLAIGGSRYSLSRNDGSNHLHGGACGFDRRLWTAEPQLAEDGSAALRLRYRSPDGEEGYPGSLEVTVTYTLTASNCLRVDSEARSDAVTPLSMTQHTYFNLAGEGSGNVLGHEVQILAHDYVPSDAACTLIDRRVSVSGTGADLRRGRTLGDAISGIDRGHGDAYLLRSATEPAPVGPTLAARVSERSSGRVLKVYTDESCLQFYTGVGLDGSKVGKAGKAYASHAGLCIECEGYPNASGMDGFGDILVQPAVPQRRSTIYAFSTT